MDKEQAIEQLRNKLQNANVHEEDIEHCCQWYADSFYDDPEGVPYALNEKTSAEEILLTSHTGIDYTRSILRMWVNRLDKLDMSPYATGVREGLRELEHHMERE